MILSQDIDKQTRNIPEGGVEVTLIHVPSGISVTAEGSSGLRATDAAMKQLAEHYFERFPPWGHRVTMEIYVEGKPDEDDIDKVIQEVAERMGANTVSVRTDPVVEEPAF